MSEVAVVIHAPEPPPSRPLFTILILLLVATALVTATRAIETRLTIQTGGPLQDKFGRTRTDTGAYRKAGKVISFGVFLEWNTDAFPAVLTSIRPIGAVGSPRIVGTGVPATTSIGTDAGFPPRSSSVVPVRGLVVHPGDGPLDGFQIVVGLRASSRFSGVPAFALDYSVAGQRYRAILLQGMSMCGEELRRRCRSGVHELELRQREIAASFGPFVEFPDRTD